MDFQDVANWQNNKLDRRFNSRMGWSDVSISLRGPVIEDLRAHFAQRWNFIYFEKYDVRSDARYHPIVYKESKFGIIGHPYEPTDGGEPSEEGHYAEFRERMHDQLQKGRQRFRETQDRLKAGDKLRDEGRRMFEEGREKLEMEQEKMKEGHHHHHGEHGEHRNDPLGHPAASIQGGMNCQIMRSCTKWSHGVALEHSIANVRVSTC